MSGETKAYPPGVAEGQGVVLTWGIMDAFFTDKGGYTRATTEALGFFWPLPKGWKESLVGKTITWEVFDKAWKGAKNFRRRRSGFTPSRKPAFGGGNRGRRLLPLRNPRRASPTKTRSTSSWSSPPESKRSGRRGGEGSSPRIDGSRRNTRPKTRRRPMSSSGPETETSSRPESKGSGARGRGTRSKPRRTIETKPPVSRRDREAPSFRERAARSPRPVYRRSDITRDDRNAVVEPADFVSLVAIIRRAFSSASFYRGSRTHVRSQIPFTNVEVVPLEGKTDAGNCARQAPRFDLRPLVPTPPEDEAVERRPVDMRLVRLLSPG